MCHTKCCEITMCRCPKLSTRDTEDTKPSSCTFSDTHFNVSCHCFQLYFFQCCIYLSFPCCNLPPFSLTWAWIRNVALQNGVLNSTSSAEHSPIMNGSIHFTWVRDQLYMRIIAKMSFSEAAKSTPNFWFTESVQ